MRPPLQLIALGVASAVLGAAVHALAANPDKALVYCPVGIDSAGCERIVAALSGPEGPFPGGVDRGYDGTAGTVDLTTADLSPYAVFIIPSLADDPNTKPYDLLRSSRVAYGLSVAVQGRLVVWSGTPDQGSADRPEKDRLIRNLAVWARAGTANPGTGLVVLQDHSADAAARYGWLKGFAGLAVSADPTVAVYDGVEALTDAAREILHDGSGQLAYPNMASFGLQPPAAGSGAAADARGESTEGQVVLLTSPGRPASVETEKIDYTPGETVTFTGSGWQPGEIVSLLLHEDPTTHADRTVTATADESGNIFNSEFVPEPHDIGVTFYVIASGETSGLTAQTRFTDAPPKANLDQCRNGPASAPQDCIDASGPLGWENGDANAMQAHLLEGYSMPYRVVMTDLPTGTVITLDIGYDIRNSGKHAIDYLTHYQRLEPHTFFGHPAETVTPTSGVSGISSTTTTFPIPAPSSAGSPVAGQPTASFTALPAGERVITLFGGTISGVAYVSEGSLTASQSETVIRVTFTAASATAVLAWGGHIAQASVWGAGNSASGINGSPYHTRLKNWSLGNLGNQDRALAAAAVAVPKATPSVATEIHDPNHTAVTSVAVGTTVHDKATVSGSGATPTGTVTFSWFTNGTCTGTAAATSSPQTLVNGSVDATGFSQTPAVPGAYAFQAAYSGDPNYLSGDNPCELLTVDKASPTVTTDATPTASAGGTIQDVATLAGGVGPTGTITFQFFGPNDETCTGTATAAGSATVSGNGPYSSSAVPVIVAGTYRWIASYSGDGNNNEFTTQCNDPNETSEVGKASPTVTTQATATASAGEMISDEATLTGSSGSNATGTITFTVFGPNNATCDGVGTPAGTALVTGDGTYSSSAVPAILAGTYRWIASYSGDVNNAGFTTKCNDPNESSEVDKASPTLTTTPNPTSGTEGVVLNDAATLAGGVGPTPVGPTGLITFRLFDPNQTGCTGTPRYIQTVPLAGNGPYSTSNLLVATDKPGIWNWTATYSGDAFNNAAASACGEEPVPVGAKEKKKKLL